MGIVQRSPELAGCLNEVVDRIAADNLSASINWLEGIEALFKLLSTQPMMGQEVRTKRLGKVRLHTYGKYLVYYRPITGGVEIAEVIHSARDQDRLV